MTGNVSHELGRLDDARAAYHRLSELMTQHEDYSRRRFGASFSIARRKSAGG